MQGGLPRPNAVYEAKLAARKQSVGKDREAAIDLVGWLTGTANYRFHTIALAIKQRYSITVKSKKDAVKALVEQALVAADQVKIVTDSQKRDLSVGFGPWRESAARNIYKAAIAGKLRLYLVLGKLLNPGEDIVGNPELVPSDVLALVIRTRGGFPDHPTRVRSPRPSNSPSTLAYQLVHGTLVVEQSEFASWYERERRKGRWQSQAGKATKQGRPPRTSTEPWIERISKCVNLGRWIARRTTTYAPNDSTPLAEPKTGISALAMLLVCDGYHDIPSDDTLARIVDHIFMMTGDSRYCRRRRRTPPASRKTR
jgi:hypothetical protein